MFESHPVTPDVVHDIRVGAVPGTHPWLPVRVHAEEVAGA
jgi:hypothetical protein